MWEAGTPAEVVQSYKDKLLELSVHLAWTDLTGCSWVLSTVSLARHIL